MYFSPTDPIHNPQQADLWTENFWWLTVIQKLWIEYITKDIVESVTEEISSGESEIEGISSGEKDIFWRSTSPEESLSQSSPGGCKLGSFTCVIRQQLWNI